MMKRAPWLGWVLALFQTVMYLLQGHTLQQSFKTSDRCLTSLQSTAITLDKTTQSLTRNTTALEECTDMLRRVTR